MRGHYGYVILLTKKESFLEKQRESFGTFSNLKSSNVREVYILKFTDLPIDSGGFPYSRPGFWLDPKEYRKICSEINQIYYAQYCKKRIAAHISFGIDGRPYTYWFENHGFNDYNIYQRVYDGD